MHLAEAHDLLVLVPARAVAVALVRVRGVADRRQEGFGSEWKGKVRVSTRLGSGVERRERRRTFERAEAEDGGDHADVDDGEPERDQVVERPARHLRELGRDERRRERAGSCRLAISSTVSNSSA